MNQKYAVDAWLLAGLYLNSVMLIVQSFLIIFHFI